MITAIVALAVAVVSIPAAIILPPRLIAQGKGTASSSAQSQCGYIIKEYDGQIAVYCEGNENPMQILNVYTETLPSEIQQRLKTGIHVKSRDELLQMIENYTS